MSRSFVPRRTARTRRPCASCASGRAGSAAAIEARFFGGHVDGEPVTYASPLLDGAVAQIEDVATHAEHRGKGLARAVVLRCLAEARRAGAELVWLVADDKDWPKELYARLGFDPLGVETMFGRPAE